MNGKGREWAGEGRTINALECAFESEKSPWSWGPTVGLLLAEERRGVMGGESTNGWARVPNDGRWPTQFEIGIRGVESSLNPSPKVKTPRIHAKGVRMKKKTGTDSETEIMMMRIFRSRITYFAVWPPDRRSLRPVMHLSSCLLR